MEALGCGNGGVWGWYWQPRKPKTSNSQSRRSKSSDSMEANRGAGYRFPVNQAATAASLVLTGDTMAQVRDRWIKRGGDSFKRHSSFGSHESHKPKHQHHRYWNQLNEAPLLNERLLSGATLKESVIFEQWKVLTLVN